MLPSNHSANANLHFDSAQRSLVRLAIEYWRIGEFHEGRNLTRDPVFTASELEALRPHFESLESQLLQYERALLLDINKQLDAIIEMQLNKLAENPAEDCSKERPNASKQVQDVREESTESQNEEDTLYQLQQEALSTPSGIRESNDLLQAVIGYKIGKSVFNIPTGDRGDIREKIKSLSARILSTREEIETLIRDTNPENIRLVGHLYPLAITLINRSMLGDRIVLYGINGYKPPVSMEEKYRVYLDNANREIEAIARRSDRLLSALGDIERLAADPSAAIDPNASPEQESEALAALCRLKPYMDAKEAAELAAGNTAKKTGLQHGAHASGNTASGASSGGDAYSQTIVEEDGTLKVFGLGGRDHPEIVPSLLQQLTEHYCRRTDAGQCPNIQITRNEDGHYIISGIPQGHQSGLQLHLHRSLQPALEAGEIIANADNNPARSDLSVTASAHNKSAPAIPR